MPQKTEQNHKKDISKDRVRGIAIALLQSVTELVDNNWKRQWKLKHSKTDIHSVSIPIVGSDPGTPDGLFVDQVHLDHSEMVP